MSETQSTYNYKVVRQFAVMTVIWGIVGMLVGVIIAAQLVWPELNMGFLHFGRLRPLHTNAVIFAFGGCALFATSYWCRPAHLPRAIFSGGPRPSPSGAGNSSSSWLPITLPLGITQGKEYAELEWPIDILITWSGWLTRSSSSARSPSARFPHLCCQLVLRGVHSCRRPAAYR
jgi:cytochrome c oxidase cbb3-type subunit 1